MSLGGFLLLLMRCISGIDPVSLAPRKQANLPDMLAYYPGQIEIRNVQFSNIQITSGFIEVLLTAPCTRSGWPRQDYFFLPDKWHADLFKPSQYRCEIVENNGKSYLDVTDFFKYKDFFDASILTVDWDNLLAQIVSYEWFKQSERPDLFDRRGFLKFPNQPLQELHDGLVGQDKAKSFMLGSVFATLRKICLNQHDYNAQIWNAQDYVEEAMQYAIAEFQKEFSKDGRKLLVPLAGPEANKYHKISHIGLVMDECPATYVPRISEVARQVQEGVANYSIPGGHPYTHSLYRRDLLLSVHICIHENLSAQGHVKSLVAFLEKLEYRIISLEIINKNTTLKLNKLEEINLPNCKDLSCVGRDMVGFENINGVERLTWRPREPAESLLWVKGVPFKRRLYSVCDLELESLGDQYQVLSGFRQLRKLVLTHQRGRNQWYGGPLNLITRRLGRLEHLDIGFDDFDDSDPFFRSQAYLIPILLKLVQRKLRSLRVLRLSGPIDGKPGECHVRPPWSLH